MPEQLKLRWDPPPGGIADVQARLEALERDQRRQNANHRRLSEMIDRLARGGSLEEQDLLRGLAKEIGLDSEATHAMVSEKSWMASLFPGSRKDCGRLQLLPGRPATQP